MRARYDASEDARGASGPLVAETDVIGAVPAGCCGGGRQGDRVRPGVRTDPDRRLTDQPRTNEYPRFKGS